MSKVSSRWVPQNLNVHNRHQHVASCQNILDFYTSDKEKFCCPLITGDETWIHHWDPKSTLESMQWKHVDCPPPKNLEISQQLVKVMTTILGILKNFNGKLLAFKEDNYWPIACRKYV